MSKLTVKDVDTHEFINAYAQHLKRSGKIELPKVPCGLPLLAP